MSDELRIITYKVHATLLELADLQQNGPILKVVHRFWDVGTECLAGEEVWGVFLMHRGKEFQLPLSLALRLLLNYLGETRHIPQSATQIAAGIRQSDFYSKHGANSGIVSRRRIVRSAVKEYIKRLRLAFGLAFAQAGLNLDPKCVVISHQTMSTEVQYQLRATIQLVHV